MQGDPGPHPPNTPIWVPVLPSDPAHGAFLDSLHLQDHGVRPDTVRVHRVQTPWWGETHLYMARGQWEPRQLALFAGRLPDGQFMRLNGSSSSIHAIHAQVPPRISSFTVENYTRFFMFFMRGADGPFLLAESADTPYLPRDGFSAALQLADGFDTVADTYAPLGCAGAANTVEDGFANLLGSALGGGSGRRSPNDPFSCTATLYYAESVFRAGLDVGTDGRISLRDDRPLATGLGARVVAPIMIEAVGDSFVPHR